MYTLSWLINDFLEFKFSVNDIQLSNTWKRVARAKLVVDLRVLLGLYKSFSKHSSLTKHSIFSNIALYTILK